MFNTHIKYITYVEDNMKIYIGALPKCVAIGLTILLAYLHDQLTCSCCPKGGAYLNSAIGLW